MEIVLNGKKVLIEERCNLHRLVCEKVKNPDTVIVEYNGGIAEKNAWKKIDLKKDDKIEIIRFVGGG